MGQKLEQQLEKLERQFIQILNFDFHWKTDKGCSMFVFQELSTQYQLKSAFLHFTRTVLQIRLQ